MSKSLTDAPVTFTHDTLHAVANQLALIVSYTNLMVDSLPATDPQRDDVLEIRRCAHKAATLLGRPFRSIDP